MKKNKSELELDNKLRIKTAMKDMENLVAKQEIKKKELLEKARKAKANNDTDNYNLARRGLAITLGFKQKVEKMLMTMDIVMSLKDVVGMSQGFLSGMEVLCADLANTTGGVKFGKTSKAFNGALGNVNGLFNGLDTMLDGLSMGIEALDRDIDPAMSKEIDDLITHEEVSKTDNLDPLDTKIQEQMSKLKSDVNN